MTCPRLEYRSADDTHSFDHERPYCVELGEFVSPMRADVCNDRFDFSHCTHCEVFRSLDVQSGLDTDEQTPIDATDD